MPGEKFKQMPQSPSQAGISGFLEERCSLRHKAELEFLIERAKKEYKIME